MRRIVRHHRAKGVHQPVLRHNPVNWLRNLRRSLPQLPQALPRALRRVGCRSHGRVLLHRCYRREGRDLLGLRSACISHFVDEAGWHPPRNDARSSRDHPATCEAPLHSTHALRYWRRRHLDCCGGPGTLGRCVPVPWIHGIWWQGGNPTCLRFIAPTPRAYGGVPSVRRGRAKRS